MYHAYTKIGVSISFRSDVRSETDFAVNPWSKGETTVITRDSRRQDWNFERNS